MEPVLVCSLRHLNPPRVLEEIATETSVSEIVSAKRPISPQRIFALPASVDSARVLSDC